MTLKTSTMGCVENTRRSQVLSIESTRSCNGTSPWKVGHTMQLMPIENGVQHSSDSQVPKYNLVDAISVIFILGTVMCFKNMTEGENIEVLMYYEDIVQIH